MCGPQVKDWEDLKGNRRHLHGSKHQLGLKPCHKGFKGADWQTGDGYLYMHELKILYIVARDAPTKIWLPS